MPQTEVSERLVLINSPDEKKHVVFNYTSARDRSLPCLHCAHGSLWISQKKSQYRRHASKQLHGDKCRIQCSSCFDLNASHIPELIKQLSTPQQKLPGETWLSTARQSLKQHTHVINRPSAYLLKPYGTQSGCLKLKSGALGCSPTHSKTKQTSDTTCAHTTGPSDASQAV